MKESTVWVESIVSHKDGEPKVQVTWRESSPPLTMTPSETRSLAANLLEAAEAAEQDAFMIDFAVSKFNSSRKAAAGLLVEFREWREEKRKNAD